MCLTITGWIVAAVSRVFCPQLSGSVLQFVDAEFRRGQYAPTGGGRQRAGWDAVAAGGRHLQRADDDDDSARLWPGHAKRHAALSARLSVAMVSAVSAAVASRDVRRRPTQAR